MAELKEGGKGTGKETQGGWWSGSFWPYYQFSNCLIPGTFNSELHDLRRKKVTVCRTVWLLRVHRSLMAPSEEGKEERKTEIKRERETHRERGGEVHAYILVISYMYILCKLYVYILWYNIYIYIILSRIYNKYICIYIQYDTYQYITFGTAKGLQQQCWTQRASIRTSSLFFDCN